MSKHTTLSQLKKLALRTKGELTALEEQISGLSDSAFKSLKVTGNKVEFFTTEAATGTAAASFDFPAEAFLDQNKTQFVDSFAWSETAYPGSVNPNMDGKPVFVLAVAGKTAADSVSYSFVNMATLVDTYKAKATGKDSSTTITIAGYEVEVAVNISSEAGNLLVKKDDGLYVGSDAKKADKVTGATAGNLAGLDASGNMTDSGKKPADFVAAEEGKRLMTDAEGTKLEGIAAGATKVEASTTPGNIKVNGNETTVAGAASATANGLMSKEDKAKLDGIETATDAEVDTMLTEVFGAAS